MAITFSDGAFDSEVRLVQHLPKGYLVSLLPVGVEPDPSGVDCVPDQDVAFVSADGDGVRYCDVDPDTFEPVGPVKVKAWTDFDTLHVW